ncbi:hypothetical protein ABZ370_12835 [Streptomyces sp. NPDC005962]|uniref:hypothetical protein n=1 Tax=Streptomyces sp. NPDC005962 TaxID=3154466 RepID=UPI0033D12C76
MADAESTENTENTEDSQYADEPPRPWWHWRSLTRGRLRLAVATGAAGAVAGALLGGAGVAWQAEAGPFADGRACWGAFSRDDVAELFKGKTDIETSEVPLSTDHIGSEGPSGECRLTSPRGRRITVQAHRLDTRFGGAGDQWADEYLSPRLTPLGGGMLGMASDTRAWLAVPDGCAGRSERDDGPLVIDMESGWTVYDNEVDTAARDQLARAVVRLVNGYMAGEGCAGTLADPVDRLPKPARFLDEKAGAVCGIKGLRVPKAREDDVYFRRPLVTPGEGPVRTCDRDVLFDHPSLRLMTVEDPRLSALYQQLAFDGGKEIKSGDDSDGRGFIRDDLGLFQAECQTGEVTFLVRADDAEHPGDIRTLLPRYVAAEADRIGCGPLRITLPEDA